MDADPDPAGQIWLQLLLLLVLIFVNAFFAASEIAVISLNDAKIRKMAEDGHKKAQQILKLTADSSNFLATIQIGVTLAGFLTSATAAQSLAEPLADWFIGTVPAAAGYAGAVETVSVVVITLIMSYFSLVLGELVPKRIAMKKSEQIALGVSGLLSFISLIFRPIVGLLSVSTNLVLRLMGIDPNETDDNVSEEEIRMMVDAGSEKGTIDHQEKEFIQNVFEFNDIMAGEIATHRTDVTALMTDDTLDEWDEIIHESRHTRYPVCDGSTDNVIGILNAKDYFRITDRTKEKVLEEAVHPAYFVPETIKADVLFRDMKNTRNSLAVVLDEYGGMVGIITLNDLIEELVGELNDEPADPENEDPHIEKIDDTSWRVIGNVELCDLEEETGVELASDDYDTLTGLVFDKLGMIPVDGPQNITIELDKLTVHIDKIESHQIDSAVITLKPSEETDENEE